MTVRIEGIEDFWVREFAFYLKEHRHPLNRLAHLVGIPILLSTLFLGIAWGSGSLFVSGQLLGWALQLLGHRIEGNRPALLKRKMSFLMGPLMVLIELAEYLGLRFSFAERARLAVGVD